jgi:cell division protein FtsQ
MLIKLGTNDDLLKKLNRAINIITEKKLTTLEGYVDVSFTGNPVYHIGK